MTTIYSNSQWSLGKVDEKATQLHAIASLKVLLDATKPHNGAATSTTAHYSGNASKETTLQLQQGSQGTATTTTTGITASIQELPNGGLSSGLDGGLESVHFFTINFSFNLRRYTRLSSETSDFQEILTVW